jgi:hypothetical protein
MRNLSAQEVQQILEVPEFANNSDYNNLEPQPTLEYMKALYVDQMHRHFDISDAVLCDCAAGYGWLGLAFLLCGGGKVVFVEPLDMKLVAVRKFCDILGLTDRCEFRKEFLQDLPLADYSVDIFATIETLEHVGKENVEASIKTIDRLTRKMVIVTTPNRLFPVISHDSKVPFAHWLPVKWRDTYLKLWGKSYAGHNHFLIPKDLGILRGRFSPVSRALTFPDFDSWVKHYPCFSPYGKGRWKQKPSSLLSFVLRITSTLLGTNSYLLNPNLASVWLARNEDSSDKL